MKKIEENLKNSDLVHHKCSKCGFNGYISKDLAKWHEDSPVTFGPLGFTCKYGDDVYTIIEHGPIKEDHTRDHNLMRFSRDGFFVEEEIYNSEDLMNLMDDIELLNKKELFLFKKHYGAIVHFYNPEIKRIFSAFIYMNKL